MKSADKNFDWTIDRIPNWVRWVVLLPSSLLVIAISEGIIFTITKTIVAGDNGYGDITSVPESIKVGHIFAAFFSAVACLGWIHYVSPSKKLWVQILSVGLFFAANIANLIDDMIMIRHGHYYHAIEYVLSSLGSVLGFLIFSADRPKT
jgi:hypothetical protein